MCFVYYSIIILVTAIKKLACVFNTLHLTSDTTVTKLKIKNPLSAERVIIADIILNLHIHVI
jgi:hypothetical protein